MSQEDKSLTELIGALVLSTYNKRVLSDIRLFAGLLDVSFLKKYKNPVLAFSADGVGTKSMVAAMEGQYSIGRCLFNHCVNDILTTGATPIACVDYFASDKLQPEIIKQILTEMATACQEEVNEKVPIIAGETAKMPGIYQKGQFDLVGFILGAVEKEDIIDGSRIEEGDLLIGLPSNGLHTNGYTESRQAFLEVAKYDIDTFLPELGCTIGKELLKTHKCYFKSVMPLLRKKIPIHGIAHITGGGFFKNLSRLLKDGLTAEISYQWPIPPVFRLIQQIKGLSNEKMRTDFNLGIGQVLMAPPQDVYAIRSNLIGLGEPINYIIGQIKKSGLSEEKVIFTY